MVPFDNIRYHSPFGTIWKLGCGFLFAFHSNYGRIFNHLWDIRRQCIAWPWKPYMIFYWSAIVNIALFCTVFELFNVE